MQVYINDLGDSNTVSNTPTDTMKNPSNETSIRYSGQCSLQKESHRHAGPCSLSFCCGKSKSAMSQPLRKALNFPQDTDQWPAVRPPSIYEISPVTKSESSR